MNFSGQTSPHRKAEQSAFRSVNNMKFTALLVEDNDEFRHSINRILTEHFPFANIIEAVNTHQALQLLSGEQPDLILMDINLPDGNGLKLTRRIKREGSDSVIVILTSNDIPEYRQAAMDSGASHFLGKNSVTSEELLSLVGSIARDRVRH
jgi:DNA-binding NarL/FixJ family response regulator